MSNSMQAPRLAARLLCLWSFPGKNTEVGCHFLQGIFLTQGSNLSLWRLLHWQAASDDASKIQF